MLKYIIGIPLSIFIALPSGIYFGSIARVQHEAQRQQPVSPVVTTVVSHER